MRKVAAIEKGAKFGRFWRKGGDGAESADKTLTAHESCLEPCLQTLRKIEEIFQPLQE